MFNVWIIKAFSSILMASFFSSLNIAIYKVYTKQYLVWQLFSMNVTKENIEALRLSNCKKMKIKKNK